MNILASSPFCGLSIPESGGQNRFSNLIKELRKRGNNIIVLEPKKFVEDHDYKLARIYTYNETKLLKRNFPATRDINFSFISKLLEILKTEKVDLIQLSHPSGILIAKLTKNKKVPIIYDAHNVESSFVTDVIGKNPNYSKAERIIIPLYIRFLEKFACKHFVDHIICVSYKDKKSFMKKYGVNKEKISIIPSGCYIHSLLNEDGKRTAKESMTIEPDKLIVFFHGSCSHPPNKDAFKTIEEYIAPKFEKNSKIIFLICGTGLPKFERGNVVSLGFVDNLQEVLSMSDIAIVPILRGGGTKLKVLDYMGAGLPMVTTKKGIEGINAKNYEHAIIVDDVNKEFINAIKYLEDNEEERKRIGANARRLAEEEYGWERIGEKLDELYKKLSKVEKCNR